MAYRKLGMNKCFKNYKKSVAIQLNLVLYHLTEVFYF